LTLCDPRQITLRIVEEVSLQKMRLIRLRQQMLAIRTDLQTGPTAKPLVRRGDDKAAAIVKTADLVLLAVLRRQGYRLRADGNCTGQRRIGLIRMSTAR